MWPYRRWTIRARCWAPRGCTLPNMLRGLWLARWLCLAACFLLPAAPAAATPALHVIPFPGTPDASPLSHIVFSSLQPSQIRTVSVTGSQSGMHTGRLQMLPDGAGTAFIPDDSFSVGEHVTVAAALSSSADGTASGDPGAVVIRFSFTIAVPVRRKAATAQPPAPNAVSWPDALSSTSTTPTQSFRSAPGLHPPTVD